MQVAQSIRDFVIAEVEKADVDEDDYHDKQEFLEEVEMRLDGFDEDE